MFGTVRLFPLWTLLLVEIVPKFILNVRHPLTVRYVLMYSSEQSILVELNFDFSVIKIRFETLRAKQNINMFYLCIKDIQLLKKMLYSLFVFSMLFLVFSSWFYYGKLYGVTGKKNKKTHQFEWIDPASDLCRP